MVQPPVAIDFGLYSQNARLGVELDRNSRAGVDNTRPTSPNGSACDLLHAFGHFFGCDVLDVRHHTPSMAPRILDLAGAIAVKLVFDGLQNLCTFCGRLTDDIVNVLDID